MRTENTPDPVSTPPTTPASPPDDPVHADSAPGVRTPVGPARRSVLAGLAAATATAAGAGTALGAPGAGPELRVGAGPARPAAPQRPSADAPETIPALRSWIAEHGSFRFRSRVVVPRGDRELRGVAETFAEDLEALTGSRVRIEDGDRAREGSILLTRTRGGAKRGRSGKAQPATGEHGTEAYGLDVAEAVTISGSAAHGVFNGTRTVLQLLAADHDHNSIPRGKARDWPDKEVRGALVDNTPRHYSMTWWKDLFRQMSHLKLNQTNLYIDGIGLDRAERKQIDELAAQYFIELVPQLNMPGHMAQILPAHPEYQLVNADGTKNPVALDLTNPKAVDWALDRMEEHLEEFDGPEWHLGSDEFPGWPGTGADHPQLDAYAQERFGKDAAFADLFADFQNQANARVKKHGKTMLVWNDMIRASKVVTLDADVTVEYWIQHPDLPGLLSGPQIAERGNPLINSHVDFMYYDQSKRNLDPRDIYESFDVNRIALDDPVDPRSVRGARICVWLAWINTPMESDAEVLENILPPLQALSQVLWGSPRPAETWDGFASVREAVGRAPGLIPLSENAIRPDPAIAHDAEERIVVAARDAHGRLHLSRQIVPGLTRFDVHTLAKDAASSPLLAADEDGALVLASRTRSGGLLLGREKAPADGRFAIERPRVQADAIALSGGVAIVRDGGDLRAVDADGGKGVRIARHATGTPSAAHDGERTVVVARRDGGRRGSGGDRGKGRGGSGGSAAGLVLVRGAGDSWRSDEIDDVSPASDPIVLAHEGEARLLVIDEDARMRLGTVEGDAVTWATLGTGASGAPTGGVGPDGAMHAAWRTSDGALMHADVTDGAGKASKAAEDVLDDPTLGFDRDGGVRLLVRTGRCTLRVAATAGSGWETADLAESTVGRAPLSWDSHGWPTYVTATSYGDLQTGTQWGKIADWGRDFMIGTISAPSDDLLPSALARVRLRDRFTKDTSDRFEVLQPQGKESAPAPRIGGGRLEISSDDPFFSLLAADTTLAKGNMSIEVQIGALLESAKTQNTVMVGTARDAKNYAVAWYSAVDQRIGFDVVSDGVLLPSGAGGTVPAVLGAGDRLGVTVTGTWMAAHVQHQGVWSRVHTGVINAPEDMTDPEVRGRCRAATALRGDAGTLALGELVVRVR
ncbi:family 20 glycosylhydrolase [Brachybacterium kimchii]|uniref:Beta-N-acetylhexosaminidase n=1 Tax=Brachybacterium kimchii TaxID=2942909 RepID=A0ABY4N6Y3_9MICO|nr:family 20 glycosylhydrolase [Brachybacterium kimchii]UQN28915.1 beta-N-acetylhexosaminidase [Brachybacterium kimchii]